MGKDARGHGSNKRGVTPAVPASQSHYTPGAQFGWGAHSDASHTGEEHVHATAAQHGIDTSHLVAYKDPLAPEPSNPWQDIRKGSQRV